VQGITRITRPKRLERFQHRTNRLQLCDVFVNLIDDARDLVDERLALGCDRQAGAVENRMGSAMQAKQGLVTGDRRKATRCRHSSLRSGNVRFQSLTAIRSHRDACPLSALPRNLQRMRRQRRIRAFAKTSVQGGHFRSDNKSVICASLFGKQDHGE
jgi:hypothetical protein